MNTALIETLRPLITNTGARLKVNGYRGSDGEVRDLDVELIGREGYHQLLRESLTWIGELNTPIPGVSPEHWDTVRMELNSSWSTSLAGAGTERNFKGPPLEAVTGTPLYTRADRPDAVFLMHLKSHASRELPDVSTCRTPVTAGKKLVLHAAPLGAYIGQICLEPGKYESLSIETSKVSVADYQKQAMRTSAPAERPLARINESNSFYPQSLHACLGLASEVGELFEATAPEHVKEELGDAFWFVAEGANTIGVSFHELYQAAEHSWKEERTSTTGWDTLMRTLTVRVGSYCNHVKAGLFGGKSAFRHGAAEISLITRLKMDLEAVVRSLVTLCHYNGWAVEDVLTANILKLRTRYPDRFTEHAFANRDKSKEFAAMSVS